MYVIDVIPLSRTAPGILSYRSAKKLAPGSIVDVMLRRTKTQGIVVGATPVQEAKELLKNVRFQLSKSAPSVAGSLPKGLMEAAEAVAHYHAASVGSVLTALMSEQIRAGVPFTTLAFGPGAGFRREAVEAPLQERAASYAARITHDADAGAATLLVVPTIAETLFWKRELKAHRPLVLSGTLTAGRRAEALVRAQAHTGLIIATPSFSWVPVEKLGSIIVERISAGTYTLPKRPHLSLPQALALLAEARSIPFVMGDLPLPLELRPKPDSALAPGIAPAVATLVDARADPEAQVGDREAWSVFPHEVIESMKEELDAGGSVVALGVRKGYAPAVVCRDCGQAQVDARGMPYSFTQQGERRFVTADGASVIEASKACQRCASWNLLPLGVGIERIEEELRAAFPRARIAVAHAESVTTPKKAAALVSDGLSPGSILIGTEALMPWLYLHASSTARPPLGVIASADSLLALPFWRARERFIRVCYLLSGVCRAVTLITRRPEDAAVVAVANPADAAFWKEELALRTALRYPPAATLVSISIEDSAPRAQALADTILADLSAFAPIALEARPLAGRVVRIPLLMQVPAATWPDAQLAAQLASLPPTVRVRIDPDSIW